MVPAVAGRAHARIRDWLLGSGVPRPAVAAPTQAPTLVGAGRGRDEWEERKGARPFRSIMRNGLDYSAALRLME